MNYLAHLYFAQATADSHYGNLLGDFGGSRYKQQLKRQVALGLENHYLVDKYTDKHPLIKQAKSIFSNHRRRFAGIAVDVLFDHFLIRHWHKFHPLSFAEFKARSYQLLRQNLNNMPNEMQYVVSKITQDDWFKTYESIDGLGLALDNIAKRIRFTNQFHGSIEDIKLNYDELNELFLLFFPQLQAHVKNHSPEIVTLPTKKLERNKLKTKKPN